MSAVEPLNPERRVKKCARYFCSTHDQYINHLQRCNSSSEPKNLSHKPAVFSVCVHVRANLFTCVHVHTRKYSGLSFMCACARRMYSWFARQLKLHVCASKIHVSTNVATCGHTCAQSLSFTFGVPSTQAM